MFFLRKVSTCNFMVCFMHKYKQSGRCGHNMYHKTVCVSLSWGWTFGCSNHTEENIIELNHCWQKCPLWWFLLHMYITMDGSRNVEIYFCLLWEPGFTLWPPYTRGIKPCLALNVCTQHVFYSIFYNYSCYWNKP